MRHKSIIVFILFGIAAILIWLSVPVWLDMIFPGINKEQLENLFSPINALFSALALLGLIYTVIQQQKGLELQREELKATREELHTTAEANQTIVSDSKVTALINLYLFYYDKNEFRKTRSKTWFVLRKMIQNEDYFHYTFERGVMAARGYKTVTENHRLQFQGIYSPDKELSIDEYLVVDNEHRHQFDDLLNFYNLLAVRSIPKEFFQKVDFNYDGWRQLLYWYAFNAESEFDKDENLRKLCSPMTLKESLQKLDIQFDFESPETFEVVCEFPIVRTFLNQKI